MRAYAGAGLKALAIGAFAFLLIGPLLNLVLWSVAERWYTPFKLPVVYGFRYWEIVFRPTGDAMRALSTSVAIACLVVVVALAVSVPAGFALARLKLPARTAIMIAFLLPQAFPSIAIYINVAQIFYGWGLTGTITGVVLVHAAHALVYSVWISSAAFAAVDTDLELAARNIGASTTWTFWTVSLPLAAPGIVASAIFVFLESSRRIHRLVLRRRTAGLDLAASPVQRQHRRQLPNRLDHRADPARSFSVVHADHRTLSQSRRSCKNRTLIDAASIMSAPKRAGPQVLDGSRPRKPFADAARYHPALALKRDRASGCSNARDGLF